MESDALLNLEAMVGFGGSINSGLNMHPDGNHLIYSIGCKLIIEDIQSKKQEFLSGHDNNISCIATSKSGNYLASGQVTYMGFKADIIIWNYNFRSMHCKLNLHRNSVEAIAFSPNDKYLVSLGGQDDGTIVVWNIMTHEAVCGSPAQNVSAGLTYMLVYSNNDDNLFVSGGNNTLRIWRLDNKNKISSTDAHMNAIKRLIKSIQVSEDDKYFICGTTTGDILAINIESANFQVLGPEKERFGNGVTSLVLLKTGEVIVGAGDGTLSLVKGAAEKFKRTGKSCQLEGAITSVTVHNLQVFVGTANGNIYSLKLSDFQPKLIQSCHNGCINDLTFPYGCADLLVTCAGSDVRLWCTKRCTEIMRIAVPNKVCNSVAIMRDGKSLISGWDDGCIRAYFPQSGKHMYVMKNAYGGSVTALAPYNNGHKLISGSNLGHVVVWTVPRSIIASKKGEPMHVSEHILLKEHKSAVTSIRIRGNDEECISSSLDGSCIIWDLISMCRLQMIRVNTLFKNVCYHPEEHQVLTTGTDRKIGYWETYDGSMIRQLDASNSGSVNAMDISQDGAYFVTAGDDKLVKVWMYDEGVVTHMGLGHSASVLSIKISPDQKFIISGSADGAILKWKFPFSNK